jgi:DNA gyrase/topoisomerase IV subunit A
VRDESTDEVRVVLELKRDADPQLVMAYLYKHTPLQVNVQVNLTCLVPTDKGPDLRARSASDLGEMLRHFLDFRFEVVTRRLEYELTSCSEAHPPARGLREGLRRARRGHQDHPQERRARPTRPRS